MKKKQKRVLGQLKGTVNRPDYFNKESEEINYMFCGSD